MRDEALVAVDDVVVAVADGPRLYAAGIAAGLRLGLREGRRLLAADCRIEVLLLHLLRQSKQDRARRRPKHTVAAIWQRDRAADLLPDHGEREQREALAAEFSRCVELPQAQLSGFGFQRLLVLGLQVRPVHAVHLDRDELAIHKFADRLPQQPDIFRQFEIHADLIPASARQTIYKLTSAHVHVY